MALIVKEVKLETSKANLIQAIVAKQNDCNSRFLKVTFLNEGEVIPFSPNSTVTINGERKDGLSKRFYGVVNEDHTATVPLHSWFLELDGTVNCDISMIDEEGRKLTTTTFVVMVEKAANNSEDISSDPEYDVLLNLIEDVSGTKQITPQGCSVEYRVASSGWKRILVSIRSIGGFLQLSLGKRGFGNVYQSVGLAATGYVEFAKQKAGCHPTLYQLYNNEFGDAKPSGKARITKVRIGYPKVGTTFPIPNEEGAYENPENPVNCYVDVYIEMDQNVEEHDPPSTVFGMNYLGSVTHHNCYVIDAEEEAKDVGMYGEELNFYELSLNPNADLYLPEGTIEAKTFKGLPLATATTPGILYLSGTENTDYRWGIRPVGADGTIGIARANEEEIDKREHKYKPITPFTMEYAVKSVIADVMKSQVKELPPEGKPNTVDLSTVQGDYIGQVGIREVYREDGPSGYFQTARKTYIYAGESSLGSMGHQWSEIATLIDE